ncbi:hypothetical protein Bbelb_445300 [Branchiostoma belcheri]|nr:hypothetical protein Bbelb_445300 [Branchiostoma belcheri]
MNRQVDIKTRGRAERTSARRPGDYNVPPHVFCSRRRLFDSSGDAATPGRSLLTTAPRSATLRRDVRHARSATRACGRSGLARRKTEIPEEEGRMPGLWTFRTEFRILWKKGCFETELWRRGAWGYREKAQLSPANQSRTGGKAACAQCHHQYGAGVYP